MVLEAGENSERIPTISIRRDWVEADYERVIGKDWLMEFDPVIATKWLIQDQLLKKQAVTLEAKKDGDKVTVLVDQEPLIIRSQPLNQYGLRFVISGFLAFCQMANSDSLAQGIIEGKPLLIKIIENG